MALEIVLAKVAEVASVQTLVAGRMRSARVVNHVIHASGIQQR